MKIPIYLDSLIVVLCMKFSFNDFLELMGGFFDRISFYGYELLSFSFFSNSDHDILKAEYIWYDNNDDKCLSQLLRKKLEEISWWMLVVYQWTYTSTKKNQWKKLLIIGFLVLS